MDAQLPPLPGRPGGDVVLAGHNFPSATLLGNLDEVVDTGAYVTFGTETEPGQVVKGDVKASGSILRSSPAAPSPPASDW